MGHRVRMEKDLQELKTPIATHFEQRKRDDEELENLKERIEKRKAERAEQMKIRQEREKERQEAAIQNMSANYGGYLARGDRNKGKGRQTETEKYDFEMKLERQKYDINQLRQRVNEYMGKFGKGGKSSGKRAVKTLANVGARASAFK